jgi:predicted dehydrogenase
LSGWILIAGYGSIGRRHYNNAIAMDQRDVRLLRAGPKREGAFADPAGAIIYRSIDTALHDKPSVAIVTNPTSMHAQTAIAAMRGGANVVMEKPLSHNLQTARDVDQAQRETGTIITMAYAFRYHPLYRRLHEIVRAGTLGRVFHVHAWQASYLPAWHPWEDYRTSYAARSDLGGGVVKTLDHELDMLHWLVGRPTQVQASVGSLCGIGVEVEDTADMIFRFGDKPLQAHVHVCFGRQDPSRGVRVTGEAGSAELDWNTGTLTVRNGNEIVEKMKLPAGFDLNDVYRDMLADALRCLSEGRPAIPLSAGLTALEMAEAALEASQTGRAITIGGGVVDGTD